MKLRGAPAEGQYRICGKTAVNAEFNDLATRRTRPFLDRLGTEVYPIQHVLNEAYFQGMKDALEALEPNQ